MCPFCLRSFTIPNPAELDAAKMNRVSQAVFDHIQQHYALAESYRCDSCCLSFVSAAGLRKHKKNHHNPMEIFSEREVKVQPFIVTHVEEQHCVQALPMELFIPNKRPNTAIDERTQVINSSLNRDCLDAGDIRGRVRASNATEDDIVENGQSNDEDVDDDERMPRNNMEDDIIHVGPSGNTRNFLDGGNANLRILKNKHNLKEWTTERIIEAMSRMRRADAIIPNQSVILMPDGNPAKCLECSEYITTDHYVAAVPCKPCKYETHCPRAATEHKQRKHANDNQA